MNQYKNQPKSTGIFAQNDQLLGLFNDVFPHLHEYIETISIENGAFNIKVKDIKGVKAFRENTTDWGVKYDKIIYDKYLALLTLNPLVFLKTFITGIYFITEQIGASFTVEGNIVKLEGVLKKLQVKLFEPVSSSLQNILGDIPVISNAIVNNIKIAEENQQFDNVDYVNTTINGNNCKLTIDCERLLKLVGDNLKIFNISIPITAFMQSMMQSNKTDKPNILIMGDNGDKKKIYLYNNNDMKVVPGTQVYALCIDISDSMDKFSQKVKEAVRETLETIIKTNSTDDVKDYAIKIFLFSTAIKVLDIKVKNDAIILDGKSVFKKELLPYIESFINMGGHTVLYNVTLESIKAVVEESSGPIKKVVVITDGIDNPWSEHIKLFIDNKETTVPVVENSRELYKKIESIKHDNIDLYTVAIGLDSDQKFLSNLSKNFGGHYLAPGDSVSNVGNNERKQLQQFNFLQLIAQYLNKPSVYIKVIQENNVLCHTHLYGGNVLNISELIDPTKPVIIRNITEGKEFVISPDGNVEERKLGL